MDSNKVKLIIAGGFALFAALYLGISAATAQFETVAWVLGTLVIVSCAVMGRRVWLLLPLLISVKLTLMIPGRPSTELIGEGLVVGFSVLMLLMRRLPYHLKLTELEWWIILLTLCVAQVYVRNPVGVSLFGGAQVGGRPYFVFGMALLAAMLLCGLKVPSSELWTALKLAIIGGLLNFIVGLVGWFYLPLGYWLGQASVAADQASQEPVDSGKAGRINFIVFVPITLANWVSSFRNPIAACFSPRWAPVVLCSLALAALSGYRNVVGSVGLTYLVGLFYRGGFVPVAASALLGVMGLGVLSVVNVMSPLPPNIQRSLSFLPGTWNQRYVTDTKDSSNWRFEMWKEALFTERWIQNKILGDGLGFSANELKIQEHLRATMMLGTTGASGFDLAREFVMVNGDYHSGPVSAIRTIGYVGLLVMILAQIRLMVHAHRQIKRCEGTEWYPVALFFGIPIIWCPIFFAFVFGSFQKDAVLILLNAGMLRLLENNLPLPAYVPRKARGVVPVPVPVAQARRAVPAR